MRHLFSPLGHQSLSTVMQLKPLLAFDFDGTLAPIVPRPDDAKVSISIANKLAQLAERLPVAIVTGRSIADVQPRLGFEPAYIIGNHGAEDPFDAALDTDRLAHIEQLNWLRHKVSLEADRLLAAGVSVEDKLHSIAIHYRLAKDRELARATIESFLQGMPLGLHIFGGKCVVNVVSEAAPDKGKAVQHLLQRTGRSAAVFMGDDLNDEAVFTIAPGHWLTVRIGRENPASKAQFFLDSHAEVATMLQQLLDAAS